MRPRCTGHPADPPTLHFRWSCWHTGASTGGPRNLVDTGEQEEDFRSAVAHLRSLDGIDPDRVVVRGMGAGQALATAAQDPRLAAAIVQAPFSDGLTAMKSIPLKAVLRMLPPALRDKSASLRGRPPVLVAFLEKHVPLHSAA